MRRYPFLTGKTLLKSVVTPIKIEGSSWIAFSTAMNSTLPETLNSSELETDVTDLVITPDGRIRCFGLSREILALLCETGLADQRLQDHWNTLKSTFEESSTT